MRSIIFHYHYFKNAGTSVDAILRQNFGERWLTAEFDGMNNHRAVGEWIASQPDAVAFSSHTAQFPLPVLDGVDILPIVFLRHPLDRIQSAYSFEKKQASDSFGAKLAKQTDLAGYIGARLDNPYDRQCRNFQTFRMAMQVPGPKIAELDRALTALCNLPFAGLVEHFDASVRKLEAWLQPVFPEFESFAARKNVTSEAGTLKERLAKMRADIGDDLYRTAIDANLKDLCLHQAATIHFGFDG